mgnify:CR=1 FL=1
MLSSYCSFASRSWHGSRCRCRDGRTIEVQSDRIYIFTWSLITGFILRCNFPFRAIVFRLCRDLSAVTLNDQRKLGRAFPYLFFNIYWSQAVIYYLCSSFLVREAMTPRFTSFQSIFQDFREGNREPQKRKLCSPLIWCDQ